MRVLALDLGSRRIGVAVSDASGTLASPRLVLQRAGTRHADHEAVAELVAEVGAERVVVGLPLSLNGRSGPAVRLVLGEVEELQARLPMPVECHDERFTTVSAHNALAAAGLGGPARRKVVDQAAAAILLQSWLDQRRGQEEAG
ncbi:MAG TPA: Holliday junction resolvase RuvX [Acidimicrobiales bacterium]|nr:Holliday junction resolvase RuvX [Acidimicrobiales bacterium]